jgi:hypothetical protein
LGPNIFIRLLLRNSHVKAAGKIILLYTVIFTF